ncbi:hypothetical protein K505DRAFT_294208 [Melanomma pulvis-pyrius CBS 109.77]|uniref:Oxidase ustYa n=1 Tax=Melanomma pulvis-pyrius CBS 109.77 TaxID=1314802 RepID=A0A6A6XSW6_9PLEO|nr:hypothetical protein K505DRAFT_294208 [Melanomma pulvis-pyrius CBS 109.77]
MSVVLQLVYFICTLSVGISIGYTSGRPLTVDKYGLLGPSGALLKTFHYNRTFSLPPNPTTNDAWDSLFPQGSGFIQHPALAPNQSGIAVFHQLHCLNGLRKQYYAALDQNRNNDTMEIEARSGDGHVNPAHARHCFDLIRQSLMCAADTNIEPVNADLGGITGWGGERKCRDFQSVFEWAGRWAYVDADSDDMNQ